MSQQTIDEMQLFLKSATSDDAERAWGKIPVYMRSGIANYVLRGIEPGSFVKAVLQNDLRCAILRADDINQHLLPDYVRFMCNYLPSAAWGSFEKYNAWIKDIQSKF